jgi:hypothetical protein
MVKSHMNIFKIVMGALKPVIIKKYTQTLKVFPYQIGWGGGGVSIQSLKEETIFTPAFL